jgi:DNA polymerase elongation subunit (family B)
MSAFEANHPFIETPSDPRIEIAAASLRPEFSDAHELPTVNEGALFRFTPTKGEYCSAVSGANATDVTLFGVTPEGHSVSVLVSGFFPYLYVRLGSLDPLKLIEELDATLIASLAFNEKCTWSREFRAARDALVGTMRTSKQSGRTTLYRARPENDVSSSHPIVGWEVVMATLLRGSGADRGYRGLEAEPFLRIYVAKPDLVPKVKQLCHGVFNDSTPLAQAEHLARGARKTVEQRAAEDALANGVQEAAAAQEEKKRKGKEYGRYRKLDDFIPKWVPHGDTGEGDESSEDEDGDDVDSEVEMEVDDDDAETEEKVDEKMLKITALMQSIDLYENELIDEDVREPPVENTDTERDYFVDESKKSSIITSSNEGNDRGKRHIEEHANQLFKQRAEARLAEVRGPNAHSYLNQLNNNVTLTVCEADIDFVLRVMIDLGIAYNQVAEINMKEQLTRENCHVVRELANSAAYSLCESSWAPPSTPPGIEPKQRIPTRILNLTEKIRTTTTQIEVHCDFHSIHLCADKELQSTLPRTVTVSFDCEMETHLTFPKPESEGILQIGCVIVLASGKRREIGFTVGQVAKGPGEFIDDDDDDSEEHVGSKRKEREPPAPQRRWRRTLDDDVESEHILCFRTEEEMLTGFAHFVRQVDADTFLSYNGDNFDMPYIVERASVLGPEVERVVHNAWGRSKRNTRVKVRDRSYGSTAIGKHEYKEIIADGLLFYDLFQYLKRNPMIKLRSYSLNAVAKEYIDMEKENVAYSQINELQKSGEGRRKLLVYCIRDALLPVLIDRKRTISQELIERSRGTGVTVEMLLKRGMQIQCKSYLYRKSRVGMLVPLAAAGIPSITDAGRRRLCLWYTRTDEERRIEMNDTKFGGATVVEPRRGLHDMPIGTLDFFSLYPTIMISGNYCSSTLLAPNFNWQTDVYLSYLVSSGLKTPEQLFMYVGTVDAKAEKFSEYIANNASRFLRHDVLRGFVPEIERELLAWRTDVKIELKQAKNVHKKLLAELDAAKKANVDAEAIARLYVLVAVAGSVVMVLDKRQLSIKLIANSLYGYFGAKTSSGYNRDLADSVTRRGRAAILFAKHVTDTMVDDLTPESPLCAQVATFPGITNKLISIRPGSEVVTELCELLVEARKSKPPPKKKNLVARDMKEFFAMHVDKVKKEVPVEQLVRISTFYGDTDSLFIGFWEGIDFNLAARILIALSDFVSILLHQRYPTVDPHDCVYRFEFEKIFRTLLMLAKKRYVGIKYLWDKDKKCLVPANPDNEFEPSESGLETQRRDTTRLVSEGMSPVLAILLDFTRPRKEKIERACSFIYRTMVEPLQRGTIQKRLIVQTRQLRKSPHEYLEKKNGVETSLPIHVQMALRAEREQGGADAPGVPRSGDRVPFIVVKGERKEKSSSRGVDPVRVLEEDLEIDSKYYLTNHVAKAFCRVFEPIVMADRTDIPGATDKQRLKERLALTHEHIFGSRTEYHKPANAEKYYEDTKKYDDKTRFAVRGLVRYHKRQSKLQSVGTDAMGSIFVSGARCQVCNEMFAGEARGYICVDCVVANKSNARRLAQQYSARVSRDFEELSGERTSIYEHCQRCAHTEKCPTSIITCDESGCDVWWERKENEKALNEADRRMTSVAAVMLYAHV